MNHDDQAHHTPSSKQIAFVFTKDLGRKIRVSICTDLTSEEEIKERYSQHPGQQVIAIEFHSIFSRHHYFGKIFYELINFGSSTATDYFRELMELLFSDLAQKTVDHLTHQPIPPIPEVKLPLYLLVLISSANDSFQTVLTSIADSKIVFKESGFSNSHTFSTAFFISFSLDCVALATTEKLSEAHQEDLLTAFDLLIALSKIPNGQNFRHLIEYFCSLVVNTVKKLVHQK